MGRPSSVMAQRTLFEAGLKKMKRQDKGRLDAISASLILRSFMEQQQYQQTRAARG